MTTTIHVVYESMNNLDTLSNASGNLKKLHPNAKSPLTSDEKCAIETFQNSVRYVEGRY